jgi:predicted nucleic acid-binding protein
MPVRRPVRDALRYRRKRPAGAWRAVARTVFGLGIDVLPFDAEDAAHAGDIRAHLERKGTPTGPYDCLIAAQARRRGATLVTANGRGFGRMPGLTVSDWAT